MPTLIKKSVSRRLAAVGLAATTTNTLDIDVTRFDQVYILVVGYLCAALGDITAGVELLDPTGNAYANGNPGEQPPAISMTGGTSQFVAATQLAIRGSMLNTAVINGIVRLKYRNTTAGIIAVTVDMFAK